MRRVYKEKLSQITRTSTEWFIDPVMKREGRYLDYENNGHSMGELAAYEELQRRMASSRA